MSSLGYFIPNNILNLFKKSNDDDKIDKLCRKYSAILMLVAAFLLSPFKLIDQKIKCWCPKEYSGGQCVLITNFCFISEKYIPVSNNSQELLSMKNLLSHKITYYQWIIYIFISLAILCYLPCLLWYGSHFQ
jgi:hypothetical protein